MPILNGTMHMEHSKLQCSSPLLSNSGSKTHCRHKLCLAVKILVEFCPKVLAIWQHRNPSKVPKLGVQWPQVEESLLRLFLTLSLDPVASFSPLFQNSRFVISVDSQGSSWQVQSTPCFPLAMLPACLVRLLAEQEPLVQAKEA